MISTMDDGTLMQWTECIHLHLVFGDIVLGNNVTLHSADGLRTNHDLCFVPCDSSSNPMPIKRIFLKIFLILNIELWLFISLQMSL